MKEFINRLFLYIIVYCFYVLHLCTSGNNAFTSIALHNPLSFSNQSRAFVQHLCSDGNVSLYSYNLCITRKPHNS